MLFHLLYFFICQFRSETQCSEQIVRGYNGRSCKTVETLCKIISSAAPLFCSIWFLNVWSFQSGLYEHRKSLFALFGLLTEKIVCQTDRTVSMCVFKATMSLCPHHSLRRLSLPRGLANRKEKKRAKPHKPSGDENSQGLVRTVSPDWIPLWTESIPYRCSSLCLTLSTVYHAYSISTW